MAGRSPTILITDDAKVYRLLMKQCLKGHGYHCLEAAICDEGDGFDWQAIPDPRLVAHVGLAHGRGLLIARTNMDECIFHPPGNRITPTKYFSPRPSYSRVPQ